MKYGISLALLLCIVGVAFGQGGVSEDQTTLLVIFKTKEAADWSGQIDVQPGRVADMRVWRFGPGDRTEGNTWKIATRRAKPQSYGQRQAVKEGKILPIEDNGLFIHLAETKPDTQIKITTQQGEASFALKDLPFGKTIRGAKGLTVERCATSVRIAEGVEDEDYPAAASAPDGAIWMAYVAFTRGEKFAGLREKVETEIKDFAYLAEPTGGDRLWLKACRNGKWEDPLPVTDGKEDLHRPAVAVDGSGRVWVFYAKNVNPRSDLTDGNWELMARSFSNGQFGPAINISNAPGPDFCPAAATDSTGRVWVAWMGGRETNFDIFAAAQQGNGFGAPQRVSTSNANDWDPAVAADKKGNVTVAWDTYDKGDYDVYMRVFREGQPQSPMLVAGGTEHDSRASVAYDKEGRLWVAWEQAGPGWGKDQGACEREGGGLRLYAPREAKLKIWDGERWLRPATELSGVAPTEDKAKKPDQADKAEAKKTRHIEDTVRGLNPTFVRLAADDTGAVWVAFRGRRGGMRHSVGTVFWSFLTRYDGKTWQEPALLPDSDNILDNRPALVSAANGSLLVIGSADERHKYPFGGARSGFPKRRPRKDETPVEEKEPSKDNINNNLYASLVAGSALSPVSTAQLEEIPAEKAAEPTADVAIELAAVKRMREYRTNLRGETLQPVRGEFHRHTEISSDGGGDSALIDMWRYALDAAYMDWLGNGDHDNGGGREYSWWTTQKTTDILKVGSAFVPMFTYERSVIYPEGHRNVVFAKRGIRTLPRLPLSDPNDENPPPAPDTQMLYQYLRQHDGVCAEHTSGTDMGTDWRNNDPVVEPFVEIYQGARQNYEMPNAPRSNSEGDSIGGWRPKGFVSLALLRGYRLAFQSSSDHGSTHMSYCNVWVTEPTRNGILDGMKKRRVYGSTENILADIRCVAGGEEHFMGEEFDAKEPPKFTIKLHGTQPFAKVHVIRQNEYVYTAEPGKAEVEITWSDANPVAGETRYYYVRGEQADGELVWISPMWIKYSP
ncbi:MAG: hypothetical protein AB1696_01035 [Planctomycetota bacterium]